GSCLPLERMVAEENQIPREIGKRKLNVALTVSPFCFSAEPTDPSILEFRKMFSSRLWFPNPEPVLSQAEASEIPNYLMTLSARNSTDCGIVRPICLAVFRLITSSNFVG